MVDSKMLRRARLERLEKIRKSIEWMAYIWFIVGASISIAGISFEFDGTTFLISSLAILCPIAILLIAARILWRRGFDMTPAIRCIVREIKGGRNYAEVILETEDGITATVTQYENGTRFIYRDHYEVGNAVSCKMFDGYWYMLQN